MRNVITPSKIGLWSGWPAEGSRFTAFQVMTLRKLGLDHETLDGLVVRRPATQREYWWPAGSETPLIDHLCPVIKREANGQVRVITPGGVSLLVNADGSLIPAEAKRAADRAAGNFSPRPKRTKS